MKGFRFFTLAAVMLLATVFASAQDTRPIFDRAMEQLKANQLEAAMNSFREVLAIDPNQPEANYNLGVGYYTLEQYERAVPASSFR